MISKSAALVNSTVQLVSIFSKRQFHTAGHISTAPTVIYLKLGHNLSLGEENISWKFQKKKNFTVLIIRMLYFFHKFKDGENFE